MSAAPSFGASAAGAAESFRPTGLEIATGLLYGCVPPIEKAATQASPRATLETLIRPHLARAPCVIAFSGGRDSSVLLAVAVTLARREGLPEPVAVTLEYQSAATHERSWQERVVEHLRAQNWVRLQVADELDLVGPVAAPGLRRHGLLYPANAHAIVPLARQATGASVLTGVGGDDVFGNWPWHDITDLFAGRRAPRAGDLRRLLHMVAPRGLRAQVLRRREPLLLPWLREPARHEAAAKLAYELEGVPRTWPARMAFSARWRPWRATTTNLSLLGADHGATVASPFLEPAFLSSLARAGGRWGWGNRTATMAALFGDLLPAEVLHRRGKAEFSGPLFGEHTRRFAGRWDGRGLDRELVDAEVLRAVWTAPQPHFLSTMALQSAWLQSEKDAREGEGEGRAGGAGQGEIAA